MIQNNLTRVLIRKTSSVNVGYSLLQCTGIDSLGYSQDKEFIRAFSNGKFIPIGLVIDPESNWEAEITTYVGLNDFLPLNDLNCLYDVLILYGTCRNPLDINEFASGIFLRDTVFTSVEHSQISPLDSGEMGVIKKAYSLICANASLLTPHFQIVDASHTFEHGAFRRNCASCDLQYVLFGNDKVYLSNGDNQPFTLGADVAITSNLDIIYIASANEFIITNFSLSFETRITSSATGNFTSLQYNRSKLYYTTDSGDFGYLDLDTFEEVILHTGTSYSDVVFVNNLAIALGTGIYIEGMVRSGFHIDSGVIINGSILFTHGTIIAATSDLFNTTQAVGKIPEQFTRLINFNGILYGLGTSGSVFASYSRGASWSKAKVSNINNIVGNYAIGNGVFVL